MQSRKECTESSSSKVFVTAEPRCQWIIACHVIKRYDIRIAQESKIFLGVIASIRSDRDVVCLINLVGGKVGGIGNRPKVRDKGSVDISDGSPVDSKEELLVSLVCEKGWIS